MVGPDEAVESGISVTRVRENDVRRKLAAAMAANGWTAAQYGAAQLLCYQRARGASLTAQQLETVARFQALMSAVVAEMFATKAA